MSTIEDNFRSIRDAVMSAAISSGRDESAVSLVAVTKFVSIQNISRAISAGARAVGENRVQELSDKLEFFNENKLSINLIGQLQINKVKYVIGNVDLIQSVDRLSLASEISKRALAKNVVQNVLIEVNIGGEAQKGGVAMDELYDLLSEVSVLPGIQVKGLMCVPPAVDEGTAQKFFKSMRRLFETAKNIPGVSMDCLSMGMSGDFKVAVLEGATMVRVGSAIFGERLRA
ncbi:MAG: YggS family pyridoxal phosphate-dependent enzyme [Clostridia bacterium]